MPKTVKFPPNVPVHQIAITADGEQVSPEMYLYELVDGRQMFVPPSLALEIRRAEIRPGEQFSVCFHWDGDPARPGQWTVWRTGAAERRRAIEEAEDPDTLEQTLRRSLELVEARKQRNEAPKPSPDWTPRTDGKTAPGPAGKTESVRVSPPEPPHSALQMPSRKSVERQEAIPADQAFLEILRMVRSGLEATGERWGDQAVQDFISTVWIQAANRGWIGRWRAPEVPARIA